MVAKKSLSSGRIAQLRSAVVEGLAERDIDADVRFERSAMPGRYRMIVTAPEFRRLTFGERQETIWIVLHERWPREEQLRLTTVYGFSDREADTHPEQPASKRRNGRRKLAS